MIVCLCHRVSDRDIAQAAAAGCASFDALQDETRVATGCGACLDCAQELHLQALQAQVLKRPARVIPLQAVAA